MNGRESGGFGFLSTREEDGYGFELRDHLVTMFPAKLKQLLCPIPTIRQKVDLTRDRGSKGLEHLFGHGNLGLERTASIRSLRQRRVKTPLHFHSKKYLRMKLALLNSLLGNTFHWHLVRNTKTCPSHTPSNTLYGPIGLRPPPGCQRYFRFLPRFCLRINGSARFHSSINTARDLIALMAHVYHGRFFNVNIYLQISTK
jgi:hypothetical protein